MMVIMMMLLFGKRIESYYPILVYKLKHTIFSLHEENVIAQVKYMKTDGIMLQRKDKD